MENFSDKDWAMLELRKDPLFHKINSRDIPTFIQDSLDIGYREAKKYKGKNIYQLYEENNIRIERSDKTGVLMNYRLRAEYVKKDNQSTVILYPESFSEFKNDWNIYLSGKKQLTDATIEELYLVHEFFHWIEYTMEKPIPQQLPKVVTMELPIINWRKKSTIIQTSEVAAHAFTKEFLDLDYFPTYLDYLVLVKKKDITVEELKSLL